MASRLLAFAYGLACYVMFLGTLLYLIAFMGNLWVPKSIDSGPQGPLWEALIVDSALIILFGLQHSVMARPWFKKHWTRLVPKSVERSTYVLWSNLAILLIIWQWRPIGGTVWSVDNPVGQAALWTLFGIGWLILLVSTLVIDHFDLFGLRQVYLHLRARPYVPIGFRTPFLYRIVRHPLYVGWILGFWATPSMSYGHMLFSVLTLVYILVAIRFEERDMITYFGDDYRTYRETVPMLLPLKFMSRAGKERTVSSP